jgi:hypothetical protein
VTSARLQVSGNTADPIGTQYTIVTTPAGTITGPFASVTLSPTLSGPFYNGTTITVTKTSVLPLAWGPFTATTDGNVVTLHWTTLQESNTSHFVVEHATNGVSYTRVGEVAAAGTSAVPKDYSFVHPSPGVSAIHYYRLLQVDKDGEASYSAVRTVRMDKAALPVVRFAPNPVRDVLQLTVRVNTAKVIIYDSRGWTVYSAVLRRGTHPVDLRRLAPGSYVLSVVENGVKQFSSGLIKQ